MIQRTSSNVVYCFGFALRFNLVEVSFNWDEVIELIGSNDGYAISHTRIDDTFHISFGPFLEAIAFLLLFFIVFFFSFRLLENYVQGSLSFIFCWVFFFLLFFSIFFLCSS